MGDDEILRAIIMETIDTQPLIQAELLDRRALYEMIKGPKGVTKSQIPTWIIKCGRMQFMLSNRFACLLPTHSMNRRV